MSTDLLDSPMYSTTMAARLTALSPARVRRWLRGYGYSYAGPDGETRTGHSAPVVRGHRTGESPYASFLDLVDLLFVKEFLGKGFSLQKVRKALSEAQELIGEPHFARRTLFSDGRGIYLQVEGRANCLLELLSGGQWAIAEVIQEIAERIDFSELSGFAERWFPLGHDGLVVLDPRVCFGRPALVGRGIPTATVYDLYLGENEQVQPVCDWMNIESGEVEAAAGFERHLAA